MTKPIEGPEQGGNQLSLFESTRNGAKVFSGGTIPPSKLPRYAINAKDPQDQFYTKKEVARHCVMVFRKTARQHGYDLRHHTYVEPSAGKGGFVDFLPPKRHVALDIDPQGQGIDKADFLSWTPPKGKYAVIGNPPFGHRAAIALAFMNRSALFADIVGFILPMTFASNGKGGAMTRVHGLRLLHSEEMPPESFYSKTGECDINTVFQVWGSRNLEAAPPLPTCDQFVQILTVSTNPNRRCGTHRMAEYDYFLQGTFYENKPPTVVREFTKVKYGSGYGIIIKKHRSGIKRALRKVNWLAHSSKSTNHCRHIRMQHIRDALIAAGYRDMPANLPTVLYEHKCEDIIVGFLKHMWIAHGLIRKANKIYIAIFEISKEDSNCLEVHLIESKRCVIQSLADVSFITH